MHSQLKLNNSDGDNLLGILTVLEDAHSWHKKELEQSIGRQGISPKIVEEINNEFQEEMVLEGREGILYDIRDINSQTGLIASHTIGPYFIDDKKYYIDKTGSITYVHSNLGSEFAKHLNSQREKLFIECVRKLAVSAAYNLAQLEEVLGKICELSDDSHLLIVSPGILTQIYDSKLFQQRRDADDKSVWGRIGNLDVLFLTILEHGEIYVVPRVGFAWCIEWQTTKLDVELINKDSELAQQLLEKSPDLELEQKVLVDGREKGIMVSTTSSPLRYFKQCS